jgi:hypothetical protein
MRIMPTFLHMVKPSFTGPLVASAMAVIWAILSVCGGSFHSVVFDSTPVTMILREFENGEGKFQDSNISNSIQASSFSCTFESS